MNNQSILIVDDEPHNFDVIESLLNEYDYELNYASIGKEAIESLEMRARVKSMLRMKQQYDALQISLDRQSVLEAEKRALLETSNIELDKRSKESSRL